MAEQILKQIFEFLKTPTGHWFILISVSLIGLWIVYNQKRQIPDLTLEQIRDDSWFITRDDNHRLAIILALKLTNKSGGPIMLKNCRLSGYSPRDLSTKLVVTGHDKAFELTPPEYDQFVAGNNYVINPYTECKIWMYYESRIVTMTGMLKTQAILRDTNRKRKSIHVGIPRQEQQILIYREEAMRY